MLVKDLKKGNVYYLKSPVDNYELKPYIFNRFDHFSYYCRFDGIESFGIIVPILVLRDDCSNIVSFGTIDAIPLSPLEVELL